jgi:hypothetical protein
MTYINRRGGGFGMWEGPMRTGMTIGVDSSGGTTSLKVGGPVPRGPGGKTTIDLASGVDRRDSHGKRTVSVSRPQPYKTPTPGWR